MEPVTEKVHVFACVGVMVRKNVDFDTCSEAFDILHERFGVADAGNRQQTAVRPESVKSRNIFFLDFIMENRTREIITIAREKEILSRNQVNVLGKNAVIERFQRGRALGGDDNVGSVQST